MRFLVIPILAGIGSLVIFTQAEILPVAEQPLQIFDQAWRISSFQEDADLSRIGFQDLAFETNGVLWAATSAGLYRYDGYGWKRFATNVGLPSLNVSWPAPTPWPLRQRFPNSIRSGTTRPDEHNHLTLD